MGQLWVGGAHTTVVLRYFGLPIQFEPRLFELKSLFPGNGILRAEIRATKYPREVHRDRGRDEADAITRLIGR
jgi:hypothetical protein